MHKKEYVSEKITMEKLHICLRELAKFEIEQEKDPEESDYVKIVKRIIYDANNLYISLVSDADKMDDIGRDSFGIKKSMFSSKIIMFIKTEDGEYGYSEFDKLEWGTIRTEFKTLLKDHIMKLILKQDEKKNVVTPVKQVLKEKIKPMFDVESLLSKVKDEEIRRKAM